MLWLKFSGWFQCRLATDPDPTDEPRGVSGYVRALAGEPDLDRVIRLQAPGSSPRSHCPAIGVVVKAAYLGGQGVTDHPLLGARVDLLDSPRFEGRNWIVAEDGVEPIVPFHFELRKDKIVIRRKHADSEAFPFGELRAQGLVFSGGEISEATGVWDLAERWRQRTVELKKDLEAETDPTARVALRKRIENMANPRLARYFPAKMPYSISLKGSVLVEDPESKIAPPIDSVAPWLVDMWCGGWDPDALCGFMQGFVGLSSAGVETVEHDRKIAKEMAFLTDNREQRRI